MKEFFKSYKAIIVVLIILVLVLLGFNLYFVKTTKVYTFSGTKEDITVLSGTIYIGHDINRFQAPAIIYNGSNITLKSGTIGYYIEDEPISIVEIEEKLKLKDVIDSSDLSFTEMHKNAFKLSKKNIENIDKLVFKVVGTAKDDTKFEFEVPLLVTYLGK